MKRTIVLLAFVLAAVALVMAQPPALDAGPVLAQETEYIFNPDNDAYTVQTEPGQNYGRGKNLLFGSQQEAELNGFIRFAIPQDLLDNGVLVKAEVRVWCEQMPRSSSRTPKLLVKRNRSNWKEGTITYQKAPRPEGSPATWDIGICRNEWTPWVDVTTLAEKWFEESEDNFGLQFQAVKVTDDDLFEFTSREGARPYPAGVQPQIRLAIVPPPSPTPTASMTYTPSPTLTPSATPTITNTPEVTDTPTPTATSTPTATPVPPPDLYLGVVIRGVDLLSPEE